MNRSGVILMVIKKKEPFWKYDSYEFQVWFGNQNCFSTSINNEEMTQSIKQIKKEGMKEMPYGLDELERNFINLSSWPVRVRIFVRIPYSER